MLDNMKSFSTFVHRPAKVNIHCKQINSKTEKFSKTFIRLADYISPPSIHIRELDLS